MHAALVALALAAAPAPAASGGADVRFQAVEAPPGCASLAPVVWRGRGAGATRPGRRAARVIASAGAFRALLRCEPPDGFDFGARRLVLLAVTRPAREAFEVVGARDTGEAVRLEVEIVPRCAEPASRMESENRLVALPASDRPVEVEVRAGDAGRCAHGRTPAAPAR